MITAGWLSTSDDAGRRLGTCAATEHPLGHEVRLYQRGEYQMSQAFDTAEQAER